MRNILGSITKNMFTDESVRIEINQFSTLDYLCFNPAQESI